MKFLIIIFIGLFFGLKSKAEPFYVLTQTDVTALATPTPTGSPSPALANNLARIYLLVVNKGANSVYFKCGSSFSGTEGVLIPAGGNYEPLKAPLCDVYLKSASGSNIVSILEGRAP